MASTIANVYTAEPVASGALRRAPLGTAIPTDAVTAPNVAFLDLGYIGDTGFTESNKRTTEKKKAFGGSIIKITQSDYSSTVKFMFMESLNANVLKATFGESNVTVTAASSMHGTQVKVSKNRQQLPHAMWIIDTLDGVARYRNVIQDGQIIDIGDVKVVHTDVISYEVTIECFEVAGTDNILTFTDDGLTTGS